MGCLEEMSYEILAKNCSYKEAREIIRENSTEIYEVSPGFKLLEKTLIGIPPILVGIVGDKLIYGYTKPCHGTFVVAVSDPKGIDHVRKNGKSV